MTRRIVADVMTRDLVAFSPETALATVAAALAKHRISGAPVVDSSGRAIGIVSAADIVNPERKASTNAGYPVIYYIEDGFAAPSIEGADIRAGRAEDVMTPLAFTVDGGVDIADAASIMVKERIHRLLVVVDDQLVGIVSTLDLLRGFIDDDARPS